jgi:hypothetical protein
LQRRRKEEEMGGEEMVASEIKKEEMGERNYKLNEYNIKKVK